MSRTPAWGLIKSLAGDGVSGTNLLQTETELFRTQELLSKQQLVSPAMCILPQLALVVEDDSEQREILVESLKSQNMDVIQCESAEAAELVTARLGADLALLVADVGLSGGGNGIELAQFARSNFPGMNILVISGNRPDWLPPEMGFLPKPFSPADLVGALVCRPVGHNDRLRESPPHGDGWIYEIKADGHRA
ncbi:CheY-like chemotaxis protein [Bradyrhizobium sp. LB14.3]|uniref:response regulator n=2 Tax=Bradyrhizobium TaxID=374 RepID=UPI0033947C3D